MALVEHLAWNFSEEQEKEFYDKDNYTEANWLEFRRRFGANTLKKKMEEDKKATQAKAIVPFRKQQPEEETSEEEEDEALLQEEEESEESPEVVKSRVAPKRKFVEESSEEEEEDPAPLRRRRLRPRRELTPAEEPQAKPVEPSWEEIEEKERQEFLQDMDATERRIAILKGAVEADEQGKGSSQSVGAAVHAEGQIQIETVMEEVEQQIQQINQTMEISAEKRQTLDQISQLVEELRQEDSQQTKVPPKVKAVVENPSAGKGAEKVIVLEGSNDAMTEGFQIEQPLLCTGPTEVALPESEPYSTPLATVKSISGKEEGTPLASEPLREAQRGASEASIVKDKGKALMIELAQEKEG